MRNLLLVFVAVFSCVAIAESFTYDIEWISKKDKQILVITINNCESFFYLDTEEAKKLLNDDEKIKKIVKTAINREKSGCKD